MTYWIFPSNKKQFDAIERFKKHKSVNWSTAKLTNIQKGDIVFLYISKPIQAIKIQTKVANISDDIITLNFVSWVDVPQKAFKKFGFSYPQGPRKISEEQADQILKYQSQQEGDSMSNKPSNQRKIPLNQILYGPPGTGKTYSTINKALEILQSYEEITEIPEDRQEQKERFDEFMASGQIEFVTFHQSYSYEEFVEGIKLDLDSQSAESNDMHYVIKDGIFKKLCQKALKNYQDSQKTPEQIKKDVELDKLLEEYANYLEERLQREGKISFKGTMNIIGIHRLKNGDFQSVIIAYEAS